MEITPGPLLHQITYPEDLRRLNRSQLNQLCDELRQYIIDVVSVHGGHFGASLGVVELTTAIMYSIRRRISWSGMWGTRPTGTRY